MPSQRTLGDRVAQHSVCISREHFQATVCPFGQHDASLRPQWMSDQPRQNALHFLNTHVHILNYTPVEHSCRNMSIPSFLLQIIETLEDDTFPVGEPVSDVWEVVTRVTVVHGQFFPTIFIFNILFVWLSPFTFLLPFAIIDFIAVSSYVKKRSPPWKAFLILLLGVNVIFFYIARWTLSQSEGETVAI